MEMISSLCNNVSVTEFYITYKLNHVTNHVLVAKKQARFNKIKYLKMNHVFLREFAMCSHGYSGKYEYLLQYLSSTVH